MKAWMKKPSFLALVVSLVLLLTVLVIRRVQVNRIWGEYVPAAQTEAAGEQPAETPLETPTPPAADEKEYVISILGDCTLASAQYIDPSEHRSIEYHIQDDYSYPFTFTHEYFENDDLTISNLECALTDVRLQSVEQFYFRAPAAYAEILTQGGVDFVTTANNHMGDFGEGREEFTYATLEEYKIPYGKEGEAKILITDSGLKVGIYCACNHLSPDPDAAEAAIRQLRADGAEYVICALHWGKELVYKPFDSLVELAHRCIDAGADLIYGSHSHCLQPVEEYGNGLILYSMGNWVFGGSTAPTDMDTAIIQVHVIRSGDGSIRNAGYTVVPCCVSSRPVKDNYSGDNYNDYRPTPYTEGSDAYNRVLSKLDGSYVPDSEGRDYSDVYAQYG
jgi:poly-gamma-glutamate synthesis protein (capsule biosynthesis protein)